MDPVIIIPTIDPDSRLLSLVEDMRGRGFTHIIVIDDGSDIFCNLLFSVLRFQGVHVYAHSVNRGKGQAIKTALRHMRVLYPKASHFVTVDADGQHRPDDVARLIRFASSEPDRLILGVRNLKGENVPIRSRFGNAFSSLYFRIDTGVICPDTQTGLRVIPCKLVPLALSTTGSRYD